MKYKIVVNDTKALYFGKQKLAMHGSASGEEHHRPLLSDELPEGSTEHSETRLRLNREVNGPSSELSAHILAIIS